MDGDADRGNDRANADHFCDRPIMNALHMRVKVRPRAARGMTQPVLERAMLHSVLEMLDDLHPQVKPIGTASNTHLHTSCVARATWHKSSNNRDHAAAPTLLRPWCELKVSKTLRSASLLETDRP